MESSPKASLSLSLSRTRTLKMQRSGVVIIAKIMQNDGTGITLGYRALMKLLAAGKFVAGARRTLLHEAERERLSLEGHTPVQPARRKLCFDSDSSDESEESIIPPSGTPLIPLENLDRETRRIDSSAEEEGEMEL